mgnify:CR=1 FL=1
MSYGNIVRKLCLWNGPQALDVITCIPNSSNNRNQGYSLLIIYLPEQGGQKKPDDEGFGWSSWPLKGGNNIFRYIPEIT